MTIRMAISRFDTLYPNEIPYERKIEWLSELDGRVHEEIIALHEGAPPTAFTGYIMATPGNTELLVPFPFDKLYIEYMHAMLELVRSNAAQYNNCMQLAALTFDSFAAEYNREHMPLQKAVITF
ncbi:MAG: hypothetical protein IJO14_07890 [Clostridia bacterium]|nr:hypothetical protein [Clostridia bacterium]